MSAVYAEWNPGVACPTCDGEVRVAFAAFNERGFATYAYRCVGCGRQGDWTNLARAIQPAERDTRPKVSWGRGRRR